MRILYIHQYFKTPEEGGAIRSYYVATALVKEGHQVTMITSHNKEHYEELEIDGIQVHYLPVYYDNELNNLERSRAFLRFLRQAKSLIDQLVPFDVCFASSTPLTVGLLAIYVSRRYKIPYIFEVRDLWPEAPIQLGYITNTALKASLRKLEQQIYDKANMVIALSPSMAEGVRKVNPSIPVHIISNMADCEFFKPTPKSGSFARIYDLEDSFVVGYFGAAGVSNHLEYLLHAAQRCQLYRLNVKFLVAAEGSQLNDFKEEVEITHTRNIVFVPYGSKQQVQNWLTLSDAVYTSFGPFPVLQTNSPNKFFDGLAAGKLSIVNTKGWLKDLVEENRCGFYANPEDPEEFVAKLKPFLNNPSLLADYQHNARRLAEEQFSRKLLSKELVKIITGKN